MEATMGNTQERMHFTEYIGSKGRISFSTNQVAKGRAVK